MASEFKQLGKVKKAELFREDREFLTMFVDINFGNVTQGFGGLALDTYDDARDRRIGTAMGLDFVMRLLDLFGVNKLDDIRGRYVYAVRDFENCGPIIGLELPEPDGGARFMLDEWREEWAKAAKETAR
jgi:hypothetical protein